jgi:hypothetical protein
MTGHAWRSARVTVSPGRMAPDCVDVDAFQQPLQLLDRQFNHGLLSAWPHEVVLLKTSQH